MSATALHWPRRLVRRLPLTRVELLLARYPVVVVGIIVALWALVLGHYAAKVTEWLVMTDEMQYVKLALSIADTGNPLGRLRGEPYGVYNQLYPLLLTPVVGLLDMPDAFQAIHRLNGLLLASTAVPAYLLARAVGLERVPSYLVAALSVGVPWTALSIIIMTENAAYPAFAWALLGIQRAVAEPSPRRDLLALAGIALAAAARTQFILLAGVLPAVAVLHQGGWRLAARAGGSGAPEPLRAVLRRHVVLVAVCTAGAVLLAALAATGKLSVLLGGYKATIQTGSVLPPGTLDSALRHVAAVTVGLGVVPVVLALAWAAATLARPLSRAQHAAAVLGVLLVPVLAVQVASFNLRFASGALQTRYLFYVAPIVLAGAMCALVAGRRLWLPALAASFLVFLLVGVGAYETASGPFFSSPETAFYKVLDGRSYQLGLDLLGEPLRGSQTVPWAALAAGLAVAAALRLVPARVLAIGVGALLAVGLALETRYVIRTMLYGPNGERRVSGTELEGRDWVDRAIPDGAHAAVLPMPFGNFAGLEEDRGYVQQQLWWDVEFWNKAVDRAYGFEDYERFTVFHTHPLELDTATGALATEHPRPYVVTSEGNLRFGLAGEVVGTAPAGYAELVRADQPLRAAWSSAGLGDDGWTGEDAVRLRLYPRGDRPTRHALRIQLAPPGDLAAPRRYALEGGGEAATGRVEPGREHTAALAVCVRAPTTVTLRVPATTRLEDGRRIGLRVRRVADALGDC